MQPNGLIDNQTSGYFAFGGYSREGHHTLQPCVLQLAQASVRILQNRFLFKFSSSRVFLLPCYFRDDASASWFRNLTTSKHSHMIADGGFKSRWICFLCCSYSNHTLELIHRILQWRCWLMVCLYIVWLDYVRALNTAELDALSRFRQLNFSLSTYLLSCRVLHDK